MKNLLASLKVMTFINIKFFSIIILLILSLVFGIGYLQKTHKKKDNLIENIKKSEASVIEKTQLINKILILDNKLLSKSLDKETTHESIDSSLVIMCDYTNNLINDDSVRYIIKDLISSKEIIYKDIVDFINKEVNIDDIKTKKSISIVSTNTKKGLFRTIIEYDTVYKTYDDINKVLYTKEYNKIVKENSLKINKLIKINNELTLTMKLIIDKYTNNQTIISFNEKEEIIVQLMRNVKSYVITSFVLIILITLFVYLLVVDIRKIMKMNRRNSDNVSLLMKRTEDRIKK